MNLSARETGFWFFRTGILQTYNENIANICRKGMRGFDSGVMVLDRRKLVLLGAAAAVRLLLVTTFPSLPGLLTGRVELSTPVTSFKRCMPSLCYLSCATSTDNILDPPLVQEGVFLYRHNGSPYDGGVFHQVSDHS